MKDSRNRTAQKREYHRRPEVKKKRLQYQSLYRTRPEVKERKNARRRERRITDPQFAVLERCRNRIAIALRNKSKKAFLTEELLGAPVAEVVVWLQNQFTDGMTWELLETGRIHIDHIIPVSLFDLTNEDAQKVAFNYKNLQPLWAEDNLIKGDHVSPEDVRRFYSLFGSAGGLLISSLEVCAYNEAKSNSRFS